jgi:hypothetical protein
MRSGDLVADMAAGYATTPRLDRLLGVPISVWSTKSFHATWWAQASDTIVANLKPDDFHVLEGTLENRLGVTLKECWLCYDRWAFSLGDFPDGAILDLADLSDPRSLRNLLMRKNLLDESDVARYQPAGEDLDFLLDAMMWYDTIGGPSFARLLNRQHRRVDLSSHLELGSAILVGRPIQNHSRLVAVDQEFDVERGTDVHITRFVIPLAAEEP